MKKLLSVILSLALLVSFTACGSAPQTESDKSAAQEQTKTFSDTEVIKAAEDLRNEYISAQAFGDYEAFSAMFVDTDEDTVKSNFDYLIDSSSYDQYFTVYIGNDGEYYSVSHTFAIVSGSYPNFQTNRLNYAMVMVYTEDGWKYNLSQAAIDAHRNNLYDALPEGYADAGKNGRNCTLFEAGNFMYLNTDNYVAGDFGAVLLTLWQDAEGNVCAGILFNNGTNANHTAQNVTLTLTDNALGTVFEGVLGSETLTACSSKYVVYTIPADQVLTGTATWGAMQSNIKHNNI